MDVIDFVFRHEQDIRLAVYEAKNDKGGHSGGSNGKAFISDPTACEAIRQAEEVPVVSIKYYDPSYCQKQVYKLRNPEKWLKVITWTRQDLRQLEVDVINDHYNDIKWYLTCERLFISKSVYYAIVQDGRRYAKGIAVGIGILTPYSGKK